MLSARGKVLSRRPVTATGQWRRWHYTPRCGRHYHVRYTTYAGTTTFNVWVKRARS